MTSRARMNWVESWRSAMRRASPHLFQRGESVPDMDECLEHGQLFLLVSGGTGVDPPVVPYSRPWCMADGERDTIPLAYDEPRRDRYGPRLSRLGMRRRRRHANITPNDGPDGKVPHRGIIIPATPLPYFPPPSSATSTSFTAHPPPPLFLCFLSQSSISHLLPLRLATSSSSHPTTGFPRYVPSLVAASISCSTPSSPRSTATRLAAVAPGGVIPARVASFHHSSPPIAPLPSRPLSLLCPRDSSRDGVRARCGIPLSTPIKQSPIVRLRADDRDLLRYDLVPPRSPTANCRV